MNLSRNDDTNVSRMQMNEPTEIDGFTKQEDQSQLNLTTINQYDGDQNQFSYDIRRKSQPIIGRSVQGKDLSLANKVQ